MKAIRAELGPTDDRLLQELLVLTGRRPVSRKQGGGGGRLNSLGFGCGGRSVSCGLYQRQERPFCRIGLSPQHSIEVTRNMIWNSETYGQARKAAGLAALLFAAVAIAGTPLVAGSSVSFNNVQVFANTQYSENYNYFFTAYNVTGALMASYQTSFPAAAFELPAGSYLVTVSAINQTYYGCYQCVGVGYANAPSGASTTSNGSTDINKTILPSPVYRAPTSEYGYQVVQVSGPTSITIATQNTTQYPLTQVSVKVSFVNGTAAAGAWVSASVVGQWYYWWGSDSRLSMYGQTGQDGMATLTIPKAPAVVSAWDWVRVNLPADQTMKKVDVGGQTVNVTVYWEPMYVGLAASTLVIPPTSSASLTLQYQPYNYWIAPMGATVTSGVATDSAAPSVSSAPTGVPSGTKQAADLTGASSQYYLPTTIPSLQTGSEAQQATGGAGAVPLLEGAAIGAALTAVAAFAVLRTRKKTPA